MKRTFRIIGTLLAALLVGLLALFAVAAATFDPNAYRDRIGDLVERQSGRTLTIAGDIGLTFFPWLAVEIDDITLGNAAGFGPEPFARADRVEVRVRLLPLLRRQIEAGTLVLHGLELNLQRNSGGVSNWDDLIGDEGDGEQGQQGGGRLDRLAISGLEVRDAMVRWDDRATATHYRIDGLDLSSGEIGPGTTFPLRLSFDAEASQPALRGRFELATRVTASPAFDRLRLDDLHLDIRAEGDQLAATRLELRINQGEFGDRRLQLRDFVAQLTQGGREARLEGSAEADFDSATAQAAPLRLDALGAAGEAKLQLTGLDSELRASGWIEIARLVPRELFRQLDIEPPSMADAEALGTARMGLRFTASTDHFSADELELVLDDSTLRGSASLRNFSAPALRFDLALDRIDLDRYLPPAKTTPTPEADRVEEPFDLPLDSLRDLNLDGRFTIGALTLRGVDLTGIDLPLRAAGGLLSASPIRANLYQGSYHGNLHLDLRQPTPRFSLDDRLQGVQIGELLDDLLDKAPVSGTANLEASLSASGNSVTALRSSLAGSGNFLLRDGSVHGINVAQIIRDAEARLRRQEPAPRDTVAETDFSELRGSFTASDGVVSNNDLRAQSPLLRIAGRGTVDVGRERLDYRLDTTLVGTLEGQGGRSLDELRGVTLPVRIQGSFSQPRFSLDLSALIDTKARREVEERIEQKVDEQRQQIEERARDQLRRLLER